MAYWIVMLVVLVAALNALQLTATAELLQRLVGFLPTIVTAIVVLILGILAAGLLATTVRTIASNAPRIRAWMQGFGGMSDERFGRSALATSGVHRGSFLAGWANRNSSSPIPP